MMKQQIGVFFLLLLLALPLVDATPFFLLTNPRSKCVKVSAPRNSNLVINYNVPDFLEKTQDTFKPAQPEVERDEFGGLNKVYEQRQKRRMEAMARVMQGDFMTITANSNFQGRNSWAGGKGLVRHVVEGETGTFTYKSLTDGMVDICVQCNQAHEKNAVLVSLTVTRIPETPDEKDHRIASEHLSRTEIEINGLTAKVEMLLSEANFAKEQEVDFHDMSIQMNKASQFWPIIHIAALILTGITQVNYMVSFFKSQHII